MSNKVWGCGKLRAFLSSFLVILFLVVPASASYSIAIDDPMTEVHYKCIFPNGSVYEANLNSTDVCELPEEGHYTLLLQSEPLRVMEDPSSYLANMQNYAYAIIFASFLVFISGGIAGTFLTSILRRRG